MPRARPARPWRSLRLFALSVALLAHPALLPGALHAEDRTNVPLKNWGGFALHRHALYDDLERLVASGLTDRTLLNTKPLSRIEAARIVAGAIRKIRGDEAGTYNGRRDLEPVLDRLMDELRPELLELGALRRDQAAARTSWVSFVPIDQAQVGLGWASRHFSLLNSQGRAVEQGANGLATFDTRLQVGSVLTFYAQPQLLGNEEYGAARLATGYAKLTLYNIELLVGRDSLWWGPGLNGSLILSNNAAPLDQIRLSSAEPFLLPWVGEWVGPTKLLFFLAQLEERRDHPRAKLAGMRGTISPVRALELGLSRAVMFDGDDRPRPDAGAYGQILFDPPAGDVRTGPNVKFRNNNLFAIDGELRFHDVDRYLLPSRDLRLYGEFSWDDTCCNDNFFTSNVLPNGRTLGGLAGIHLLGLFGREGLDARFEWVSTSSRSYVHDQFYSGYWTRGNVISHFVGTDGTSAFGRVTQRFGQNFMLGFGLERAEVGSTVARAALPRQRRLGGGIDVSYRFWERYSVFGQYVVSDVENRDFEVGNNGLDHLLRLELTRSFR
ncbi:MAG: hypothetical protein HYV93_01640 [Candidatus Rokubacteria bacterium]|nr:hypothetical protein [Candidatus Rokubacteria bacterium]